jgi:hypothetical protein
LSSSKTALFDHSGVNPGPCNAPAESAIAACAPGNVASLLEGLQLAAAEGSHQLQVASVRDGLRVRRVLLLDGHPIATLPAPEHLEEFLRVLREAAEGQSWQYVIPRMLKIG